MNMQLHTAPQTLINPWQWQNKMGFSQAIEVTASNSTLYLSGQAAIDEEGNPQSLDMHGQLQACFDNLETVLKQAGYSLKHVVRVNYYTTSISDFFQAYGGAISRLSEQGCQPSSTLLEVKALAFPQLLIEIEATAVK